LEATQIFEDNAYYFVLAYSHGTKVWTKPIAMWHHFQDQLCWSQQDYQDSKQFKLERFFS